jgi:hypothetical protein
MAAIAHPPEKNQNTGLAQKKSLRVVLSIAEKNVSERTQQGGSSRSATGNFTHRLGTYPGSTPVKET